ncbi:hypothetical protein [Paenibacillus sp.]|uniref:hypothetical protein n=1 Tax=Paenibacillus sp. TaxID=58172 RepID=UPI0028ABD456|nr:hypothetical protein [Paenibacillus sp.]
MIWFILLILAGFSLSIALMVKQRKSKREIMLFTVIVLLGVAQWISIFLEHTFKPNQWIIAFIDYIKQFIYI